MIVRPRKVMMVRALICALLVAAMVVAGCGDDDDDAATPTTAPSGSDEAATNGGADFDVTFDGEVCTVTGPELVPAGLYTFVLTDTSEFEGVEVFVDVHAEGYTWADHVNYVEEAGGDGVDIDMPDWVSHAAQGFGAPPLDLAENQTQYDYTLEAGSHGIMLVPGDSPGVWRCAGLQVI